MTHFFAKRRGWILGLAVLAVGLMVSPRGAPPRNTSPIEAHASWALASVNIGQMAHVATAVAVVEVTQVADVVHQGGLVFTDFSVRTLHVVKGPLPSVFIIHQTGGPGFIVTDDPLLQVGAHYVVFLHQYAAGHYFILAGPEGRFIVSSSNRVYSLNQRYPTVTVPNAFVVRGESLGRFLTDVGQHS